MLPRPASARDLEALIANAREQASLARGAAAHQAGEAASYGIVGTSPAMRLVMDLVQRAAAGRCGILICGERGTGREMIARAIHSHGPNPDAPFVKVDCSGPDARRHRAAAVRRAGQAQAAARRAERRSLERIGQHCRLRDAAGGILFLENVMDLPARAQARLVRVLRDREVFRRRQPRADRARCPADRVGRRLGRRGARGRPPPP